MSKSLAQQLAEGYGRSLSVPKDKSPSRNDLIVETNRNIRNQLKKYSNQSKLPNSYLKDLVKISVRAGKDRVYFNSSEEYTDAVNYIFDSIYAHSPKNEPHNTNKLLALSVLASTHPLKCRLWDLLMALALNKNILLDSLDINGDIEFILNRLGKDSFLQEFDSKWASQQERLAKEEEERRQAEIRQRLYATVDSLKRSFQTQPCKTVYLVNSITGQDATLIRRWANKPGSFSRLDSSPSSLLYNLATDLGKHEFTRLLSARRAELCAIKYYQEQNKVVEDTSILQLGNEDKRWLTHDIEVEKKAIDVKNSRRSFSQRNNYVEHCVKPKLTSASLQDVTYLGVLSEYLVAEQMMNETGPQESLILGEVTRPDVESIQNWINNTYSGTLEINLPLNKLSFIPGWLFEYPHTLHTHNQYITSSEKIDAILTEWLDCHLQISGMPRFALALTDNHELLEDFLLERHEVLIWQSIRGLSSGPGINKRNLFITVLATILKHVNSPENLSPEDFKPWLYPKANNFYLKAYPLGFYDPLEYIWNLISSLQTVTTQCSHILSKFSNFKLSGPGILKGFRSDLNQWMTILAYCGGWKRHPSRVKCGKNPIFMGDSDTCDSCLHLICPACGFCSRICYQNEARQSRWGLEEAEPIISDQPRPNWYD